MHKCEVDDGHAMNCWYQADILHPRDLWAKTGCLNKKRFPVQQQLCSHLCQHWTPVDVAGFSGQCLVLARTVIWSAAYKLVGRTMNTNIKIKSDHLFYWVENVMAMLKNIEWKSTFQWQTFWPEYISPAWNRTSLNIKGSQIEWNMDHHEIDFFPRWRLSEEKIFSNFCFVRSLG